MKVKHIARPREQRGDAWSRWDYGDYIVKVYDSGFQFWMSQVNQRTASITKADERGLTRVTIQDLDISDYGNDPEGFVALEGIPHFMARDLCRGWITGGFTTKGAGQ
jgi:hypothetical protein